MSVFDAAIRVHQRTLDRIAERRGVERLRRVYDQATSEVTRKLERLGKGSQTFTAHHLHVTMVQLKQGQIMIDKRLRGELGDVTREAQVESLHSLIRTVKQLEHHFTGHAPVLPIEDAARFAGVIDGSRQSLLSMHQSSIDRYGEVVIGKVQDQLAVSLASGEALGDAIDRVHGVIEGEFWQAERIARTECMWSANRTHIDGIQEIAEENPDMDLKQQWIEHCSDDGEPLDDRVAVDSLAMMGQVTDPGGMFTCPDESEVPDAKGRTIVPPSLAGKQVSCAPLRPNGRETIMPWSASWGSPGWRYVDGERVPL